MPATSFFHIVDPRFLSQSASHDVPSNICQALGRGVTRSKRRALQWLRKSAENGHTDACFSLPARMRRPALRPRGWACRGCRQGGRVGWDLGGARRFPGCPDQRSTLVGFGRGGIIQSTYFDVFRRTALEGNAYCFNDGCEFVGRLQKFKVCPQCKSARYCGSACQKQH